MKRIIAALLIVLVCGCMESTRYVCPDGTVVDDASQCATQQTATTIQAAATTLTVAVTTSTLAQGPCSKLTTFNGSLDTAEYNRCLALTEKNSEVCRTLSIRTTEVTEENAFDQIDCYTQLAFQEKKVEYCDRIQGNLGIVCKAIVAGDVNLCDTIPIANLTESCKRNVYNAIGQPTQQTIEECAGDAFCIAYAAKTQEDCNKINEQTNMNEQTLCLARVLKNTTYCDNVQEPIFRNVCIKEALQMNKYEYRH